MAQLDKNSNWDKNIEQNTKSSTYVLDTDNKYIDRDISLTVTAKDATLASAALFSNNATLSSSNTSGVSVSGAKEVSEAGWVAKNGNGKTTQYITGVTLDNSKTFNINDGIYNWTITKDANGNVYIV